MAKSPEIIMATDASGAVRAARQGLAVMIVDVIDMSTTLESALDAGAFRVFGASPDFTRAPVRVNPERMGQVAARTALEAGTGIIVIAEPRVGCDEERIKRCQKLFQGIERERGCVEAVIPNIGAEAPKIRDLKNRVVVAVTDTGGVAFDAAFQETELVVTGTVARTLKQKGIEPASTAAQRAVALLGQTPKGVAVVAASRNSLEDVLAAQYIVDLIKASIA